MSLLYPTNVVLLNQATATVTTLTAVGATYVGYADVAARQKMSIQFVSSSVTSGNGVFTVYVSNDGTNWVKYQRLIDNLAGTNAQTDAYVASVTLSTNTWKIYFFAAGDYFRYVQVNVAVTTDGKYSAILQSA